MAKRKVIKAKFLPAQLPLTRMVVAWLVYRELDLKGFAAGVYITVVVIAFVIACLIVLSQIWINEPSDPVFEKE